ncbi:ATP-dependent nuclease [Caryophanon tenue]|uniref:ATP-dependent endonuclease n=1 Tax=Caryophanon tenue TaxID=33978 RepID=A0A1C0YL54_9BACL|nr:AAA family ATPase [Caryophanon tenue]OCS87819.1 ATP-dependent endonuclease [Caryophanon tenue]
MYISQLTLNNFRGFSNKGTTLYFKEGINVILGENNAGKTTIIKALEILFSNKASKKLTINDFNRNVDLESLKTVAPKMVISATLKESADEDAYSDELLSVATWLTKIETPYEAKITFEFFLPENELETYKSFMENSFSGDINDFWKILDQHFLKKYVSKIYVGNVDFKNQLNIADLNKFDFQFLSAIRDVERDLFKGNNALLKEVIDFYMDYEIKSNSELSDIERIEKINENKKVFSTEAKKLIEELKKRMTNGEAQILKYVDDTGASIDNSKPVFDGEILDTELYSSLRLIVEKETGIKLPAVSNGLGYNNLIYISILLSKMQRDSTGNYLGSNAKTFSILAIEEPEAHLHPSMQYKFLQFLKNNNQSEVNQVFITTHSPNITAAVDLEDLMILQKYKSSDFIENIRAAYPSKVFKNDDEDDVKSSEYVRRFLDVTKADLFFAKNIILVEGVAEQLVVPEFAKKMNRSLEDTHTTIINIGGRYFNHFLKLFDLNKSEYALSKKVACLTDLDPVRKLLSTKEDGEYDDDIESSSWSKCLPLFLDKEREKYEYKLSSNKLITERDFSDNIKIFSQDLGTSSTFEYELIRFNSNQKKLITSTLSNQAELINLFDMLSEDDSLGKMVECMRKSKFKEELKELIETNKIEDTIETKIAVLASRYLLSLKKGEAAQELAYLINKSNGEEIIPPKYISEAIEWISR